MNTLGLKIERIRSGLTQKQFAKKLGISAVSYNRKETGVRDFSREEIRRISNVLKLSLDQVNEIFFDQELTKRINKSQKDKEIKSE